jgi:hypothetical protein
VNKPGAIADLFGAAPSPAEIAFPPEEIRAATLNSQLCRAISASLKACGRSRAKVAEAMSSYLGATVSEAILDAYASPARESHVINWPRLIALAHVTGDVRLLSVGLEQFGVALIDRRYLPYVEMGLLEEEKAELSRRQARLRRAVRGGSR